MSERSERPGQQRDLIEDLDGLRAATDSLVDGLGSLTDDEARRPSLLPGWTVGHLLTHVLRPHPPPCRGRLRRRCHTSARNVDGVRTMVEAAARGEAVPMYPSVEARQDAIEAGSGRPSADLAEMPFRRWREVEVHRVDLGLAFTWADWSDAYVARELPVALARTPERTPDGQPVLVGPEDDHRAALAWLLGRAPTTAGQPEIAPWSP